MNTTDRGLSSPRNIRGLVVGLAILVLTWELCVWISSGNNQMLILVVVITLC